MTNETDLPTNVGSNTGLGGRSRSEASNLSYRQRDVFAKAPADWGRLPGGIGCTNATMEALERRGLVETRYGIEGGFVVAGRQYLGWQWRKTPNAKLTGQGGA